ncbi:MAG: MBL fold metallo-hydrolase [Planctomycetaceae bacterium]|nr:MBL fold metallo-hydrolase [Planctomycetaceae bacterium]
MLLIHTIEVTPFSQNARVLWDSTTSSALIVDPGGDLEQIFEVVDSLEPKQLDVLLTHAHLDHAGGTAQCLALGMARVDRPVRLLAHREPILRGMLQQQAKHYMLPISEYQNVPAPDVLFDCNEEFTFGSLTAKILFTPGHAPDHIAVYMNPAETTLIDDRGRPQRTTSPIVLAGDALFQGSIGRTDLPGGSYPLLIRSIREHLLTLPPETIVLSGHGPNTTIGFEAANNPFLQD